MLPNSSGSRPTRIAYRPTISKHTGLVRYAHGRQNESRLKSETTKMYVEAEASACVAKDDKLSRTREQDWRRSGQ